MQRIEENGRKEDVLRRIGDFGWDFERIEGLESDIDKD
jgi:hypothetical protein